MAMTVSMSEARRKLTGLVARAVEHGDRIILDALYEIDDSARMVTIDRVRHRREVYG
jgi:hypothetical protein